VPGLGDESADLAQDVLIVVFREVARFDRRREGSFRAWLRQVTVNRVRTWVSFGDQWADYDLTFKARTGAGSQAFGANFRINSIDGLKCYVLILGIDNKYSLSRWSRAGGAEEIESTPGTVLARRWYTVKVSLRGSASSSIDGKSLFARADDFSGLGNVCLKCYSPLDGFATLKSPPLTAPSSGRVSPICTDQF
jgi:hypothetical protein